MSATRLELRHDGKSRGRVVSWAAAVGAVVFGSTALSTPARADFWSQTFAPIGHTVENAVHDTGNTLEKATHDTGDAVEKATHDTGDALEKATHDTGNTLEKATHDTGNTLEKAAHDTGNAVEKATHDLGSSVEAIWRFMDREGKGLDQALRGYQIAYPRSQNHWMLFGILGTDPIKNTEEDALKAAQESDILRTVAQVAATAYGGPGGAAAFAAWYTYRTTGDPAMAIKLAIITGAASAGFGAVNNMPADSASQVAEKTVVAGAIGGLAVAAAGGDERADLDGFLLAGGMVLVQTGYDQVTGKQIDARAAQGEAYCMKTVGAGCSPPDEAYIRDAAGNIQYDANNDPLVDVTKTDAMRPHVGTWAAKDETPILGAGERSASMSAVSRVPGMNAMAFFHDTWSVNWNMGDVANVATIPPAVVLTYLGTGEPFYDKVGNVGIQNDEKDADKHTN